MTGQPQGIAPTITIYIVGAILYGCPVMVSIMASILRYVFIKFPLSCTSQPSLKEFEYTRHGTQTLIAGFDVATGNVNNFIKISAKKPLSL